MLLRPGVGSRMSMRRTAVVPCNDSHLQLVAAVSPRHMATPAALEYGGRLAVNETFQAAGLAHGTTPIATSSQP